MTGATAEIMIFIPSNKAMTMRLTWSGLENMTKSKVTKKRNNLPVEKFKNVQYSGKNSVPGSLKNFSPNPGTSLMTEIYENLNIFTIIYRHSRTRGNIIYLASENMLHHKWRSYIFTTLRQCIFTTDMIVYNLSRNVDLEVSNNLILRERSYSLSPPG